MYLKEIYVYSKIYTQLRLTKSDEGIMKCFTAAWLMYCEIRKVMPFYCALFIHHVSWLFFICECTAFTVVVLLSVGCEIKVVCVCFNVQRMPYLARKHEPALHREECIPGSHKHMRGFHTVSPAREVRI